MVAHDLRPELEGKAATPSKKTKKGFFLPIHLFISFCLIAPFVLPPLARTSYSSYMDALKFVLPFVISVTVIALYQPRLKVKPLLLILFYSISIFLLTLFSLFYDIHRTTYSDLIELLKPVFFVSVFLMAACVHWDDQRLNKYVLKPLFVLLFLSLCLNVLEFLPHPFAHYVTDLYIRTKGVLQNKAVAFFSITYFAGTVYALIASLSLGLLISTSKKRYLAIALIGLGLAIATQSRTIFLGLFFGAGAFFIMSILYSHAVTFRTIRPLYILRITLFFLIILSIFGVGLWLFQDYLRYLFFGIDSYLLNFLDNFERNSGSVAVRLSQIRFALENNSGILVGSGIGKSYAPFLESLVALFYYRYGVFGLLSYFLFWMFGFYAAWRAMRLAQSSNKSIISGFMFGVCLFLVMLPLFSLSSVITDQLRLYGLYYTIIGIVIGVYSRIQRVHIRPI